MKRDIARVLNTESIKARFLARIYGQVISFTKAILPTKLLRNLYADLKLRTDGLVTLCFLIHPGGTYYGGKLRYANGMGVPLKNIRWRRWSQQMHQIPVREPRMKTRKPRGHREISTHKRERITRSVISLTFLQRTYPGGTYYGGKLRYANGKTSVEFLSTEHHL